MLTMDIHQLSPAERNCCKVAECPLIKLRDRPPASTTLRNRHTASIIISFRIRFRATSHPSSGSSANSNSALISARSQPFRTSLASLRSPSTSESASIRMDFPAPVSPVSTVKPGTNSRSIRSTMTKSRMLKKLQHETHRLMPGFWVNRSSPASPAACGSSCGRKNAATLPYGENAAPSTLSCSRRSKWEWLSE